VADQQLEIVGETPMFHRDHAIVIGTGMAGLFAARVLSDTFTRVTVLDRDTLPDTADFRSGVPQARHLHQLLISGQEVMERLFPALKEDLKAIGSPRMEWGINSTGVTQQGFIPPTKTGLYSNTLSRIGLEFLIRRRVTEIPNVTLRGNSVVTVLLSNADRTVVTGVEIENRPSRETETMTADLVVDASGRRSDAGEWLVALGYDLPTVTHVDAHVGYASCWYEKPDYAPDDIFMMLVKAHPQNGRAGMISTVEGNRWTVILTSKNKDYPPNDYEGFLEFAQSLQSPLIYNYIKDAKPISPVYGYRNTDNVWRHYEKLTRRPDNFIITGDSACAFNPIYGQGMSVAAMDAEMLDTLLGEYTGRALTGFADAFQKRLAKLVAIPFALATADDLQQPTVEGVVSGQEQSWLVKQVGLYFRALINVIDSDPVVYTQFVKVMNMMDTPNSLMTPNIIWRVARYYLNGKRSAYLQTLPNGMGLAPRIAAES